MKNQYITTCTRCGKQRIIIEIITETIEIYGGLSEVTRTKTACPDLECQKIVEEQMESQRKRTQEFIDRRHRKA